MMNDTQKAIRKVRRQLSDPNRWVKGHFAVNAKGEEIDPDRPGVKCMCLQGAFERYVPDAALRKDVRNAVQSAIGTLYPKFANRSIIMFNDAYGRRHPHILKVLDYAAEFVA